MEPEYALVSFLSDNTKQIVPLKDIANFKPNHLHDFNKNKICKVYWPQDDDIENINKYERAVYEATILQLADSADGLSQSKRYAPPPKSQLLSASDTDMEGVRQQTPRSQSKNVCEELMSTLKRRTSLATSSVLNKKCRKVDPRIILDHSEFSDSDSDEEVIPKKDYKEIESKLRATKTLLKESQKLQQTSNIEREDLLNQVKMKEEEIKLLEGKLNRVNQLNVDLQLALKEKVTCMDSSASKESLKTIKIGNCRIDEKQFQMVNSQNNISIFVKDLAVLVWSKDGLLNKSVSGTVCPQLKSSNSVARPPLTPEKLIDMADLLRKRLTDQGVSPISAGLKLMNKQIGEKIQDLRKRNRRMLINSKNASDGDVMNENGCSTSRQPNRSLFPQFETEDINISQSGEIGGGLIINED